jgi:hypothetical protein
MIHLNLHLILYEYCAKRKRLSFLQAIRCNEIFAADNMSDGLIMPLSGLLCSCHNAATILIEVRRRRSLMRRERMECLPLEGGYQTGICC